MAVYALSGKYRADGGCWYGPIDGGTRYPLGSSGSTEYDTFFNRPAAFLTDYANGANYIVSASLKMKREDDYTQTETIRFAAGSSTAGKVGSYVYHDFPANQTLQTIPFTDAAKLLISNAYIIANASSYGSYIEVIASSVDLEVIWAPVNTAPYWSAGATLDVTGTLNGNFIKEGSIITASWPICNDDDANLSYYEYAISTNGGVSYTYATTTARAITYSSSTQGQPISFAVRGVDVLGLGSAWIYSSLYTINYAPATPTITTVYNLLATQNMVIPYNASMAIAAPAHSGGFASGYTALNYRQAGTYTGVYGTSTAIALANLFNLVGQTASISVQATDGWSTATSTTYTVKVGLAYEIPALTASPGWIDSTTSLTIGPSRIDGAYYSSVPETITIYYRYQGSSTWNVLDTITRSYSSRTTPNFIILADLFKLINSKDSTFGKTSKSVEFRASVSTGHLSAGDAATIGLSLPYTAPAITVSNITSADGSTSFKYPMDSTTPVTETSFVVSFTATKHASSTDVITATIFTKVGTGGTWTSRKTLALSAASANYSFTLTFSEIGASRGQTIYTKIELSSLTSGVTIVHSSVEPVWFSTTIKDIVFRSLPSFSAALYGSTQLSFIRGGLPTPPANTISTPVEVTVTPTKGYYVLAKLKINSTEWSESGNPISLYNTGLTKYQYNTTDVTLNSTINTPAKTWTVNNFRILKTGTTAISGLDVADNTTQTITYTFLIWEAYRASNSGSSVITWDPSFATRSYSTITLTQTSNTLCKPLFNTGSVSFVRA